MVKQPSRKGIKNKVQSPKSLKDSYQLYLTMSKTPVSYKTYKEVIGAFNKKILEDIIQGGEFEMPYRLGKIRVRKIKSDYNRLKINFDHYRKTGEKIFFLNEHTGGYYYRWYWAKYKRGVRVRNKGKYEFLFNRKNKRRLSQIIMSGKTDFME